MRRKESIRQIGNVTVRRNSQLGFTHYKVGRGESDAPIDIYVSDEMKNHPEVSFKRLRQLAVAEIERLTADPYGETNIDPHVSDLTLRSKRAVNRVSDEVEAETGMAIAIKSASSESLITQYKVMRDLQKTAERRLYEIKPLLEFLPVYGAIGVGNEQFLIMEHIKDGQKIEDTEIPQASYGWDTVDNTKRDLAFNADEHPDLVAALEIYPYGDKVRWKTVAGEIGHRLRKPLGDLTGRNVLHCPNQQGSRYVIIDQVPQGRYA